MPPIRIGYEYQATIVPRAARHPRTITLRSSTLLDVPHAASVDPLVEGSGPHLRGLDRYRVYKGRLYRVHAKAPFEVNEGRTADTVVARPSETWPHPGLRLAVSRAAALADRNVREVLEDDREAREAEVQRRAWGLVVVDGKLLEAADEPLLQAYFSGYHPGRLDVAPSLGSAAKAGPRFGFFQLTEGERALRWLHEMAMQARSARGAGPVDIGPSDEDRLWIRCLRVLHPEALTYTDRDEALRALEPALLWSSSTVDPHKSGDGARWYSARDRMVADPTDTRLLDDFFDLMTEPDLHAEEMAVLASRLGRTLPTPRACEVSKPRLPCPPGPGAYTWQITVRGRHLDLKSSPLLGKDASIQPAAMLPPMPAQQALALATEIARSSGRDAVQMVGKTPDNVCDPGAREFAVRCTASLACSFGTDGWARNLPAEVGATRVAVRDMLASSAPADDLVRAVATLSLMLDDLRPEHMAPLPERPVRDPTEWRRFEEHRAFLATWRRHMAPTLSPASDALPVLTL